MSGVKIGLIGHNGLVGSKILQRLIALQRSGFASIVILHRPSSSTATVPEGITRRELDLTAADGPAFDDSLGDLHYLISAVATAANKDQLALLPALARSKVLKSFFPSEFAPPWSAVERAEIAMPSINDKDLVTDQARAVGVPITVLHNGLIADFIFQFPVQWNVRENQVFVYRASQETVIPFVTSDYIAAAILELITKRTPSQIANQIFHVVEYKHTGQEVSAEIARLSGKDLAVIPLDDAAIKAGALDSNPFISLGSGLLRKSGQGWWALPGDEVVVPAWHSTGVAAELARVLSVA